MLEGVLQRVLRAVFGGGADITVANPLPVTSEMGIESGTATAGSDTTLEDTTKNWEVDMWEDAIVGVTIGGIEYHRTIVSNTANILTFNALPALVVVAAGDEYNIRRATNPLSPLARAEEHNVALVGMPADILGADLAPINTPCLFRTQVAFDTAGVFSTVVTRGGDPVVTEFNHGVVLTVNSLFMFDMLVHSGDSVNFRYSLNAQMLVLRVQEIVAATQ